jgi:hypothetical protein
MNSLAVLEAHVFAHPSAIFREAQRLWQLMPPDPDAHDLGLKCGRLLCCSSEGERYVLIHDSDFL